MKLSFHGAARMVTGSKHLIELNQGKRILLDCGMFQGHPAEADALNRHFGFDPRSVDWLLLSHAHIDHCGLIPRLVKEGYSGSVYCTKATLDLARILLLDSARIQESDIAYHNKKRERRGEILLEPLYTVDDVENCLKQFQTVDYGEKVKLHPEISFWFTDAGHIIGSAAVHLSLTEDGKEKRITFSGDVGRYNDELLRAPEVFTQADYIILESTYGNSLHEDVAMNDRRLIEIIADTCLKKNGKLIIPAFSVGRTQELVYALNRLEVTKRLPDIPFFVDSPLSVEATAVMKKHQYELNERFQTYLQQDDEPFDFKNLHYITSAEDSKKINEHKNPCVIISASGMADAGRVKHHIKHNISDHRNTILIIGYCEPHSLGGRLMNGEKAVTIFGEEFKVNAEIEVMRSMSAHGDYDDLSKFLMCQDPAKVKRLFLVHGEYEVQQEFSRRLGLQGFAKIDIPSLHQAVEI